MSYRSKILALGAAASLLTPAVANAWTKTYVVEWLEPAMVYGGPAGGGGDTIGSDCPKGVNDMDWKKQLITSYRTPAQSEAINNAEYGRGKFLSHLGFRGPNRENIYENPTAIADPGFIEVSSTVAEGFDLDNNPNTGFTGPNGEKGIDNAFYKAGGCVLYFRAPPRSAAGFKNINDEMHDGLFTVVVTFTGESADPMNDDDVTVGFWSSQDKSVKDANGAIALDYSFRINNKPGYQSTFKARIRNGVLETPAPIHFVSHDLVRTRIASLDLENARARFTFKEDGTVEGMVGGYRDFFEHFRMIFGDGRTIQGAIRENLGHFNASGWYYALRRAADGRPDPQTGAMRGVSTTYRYRMVPAIVLPPAEGGITRASLPTAVRIADPEKARLDVAGFEPIAEVAAAGRTVRRVTYRDPFGSRNMPNVVIEKAADGQVSFTVTADDRKIRESGKISAAQWAELVKLDPALAPRRAAPGKAQVCHSKQMVIEAADAGKTRRREASICGGPADTQAVLYGYKVAELVMTNLPMCRGYIESGREYSWTLSECMRQKMLNISSIGNDYENALGSN